MKVYENWGRYPAQPQQAVRLSWPDEKLPEGMLLAYGNGRSQGDVCLTPGTLVDMRGLNRFVAFDAKKGVLTAEGGVTLDEILQLVVPQGWMLPVVPGTRFVTLGGAIANDVHGKNHHAPQNGGSFGHHVTQVKLRRTDGEVIEAKAGTPWFKATVGGMGLTGLIMQATVQLMPVLSGTLERKIVKLGVLEDFFSQVELHPGWDYSVAWVDGTAPDHKLGRGYLELARWSDEAAPLAGPPKPKLNVPFPLPVSAINPVSVKVFNELWLRRPRAAHCTVPYATFFWPLDGIGNWRNLYGKSSFVQCQFIVPQGVAPSVIGEVLLVAKREGNPSFLNTLKVMGNMTSAGMLSFPRKGIALALDFPFRGAETLTMLKRIEELVMVAEGAFYPAKDAVMSAGAFKQAYPAWEKFLKYKDPNLTSYFWQRVTGA